MNNDVFLNWLKKHVSDNHVLADCRRSGQTIELVDEESQEKHVFKVEGVPDSTLVIRPHNNAVWSILQPNRKKGWNKSCDYVLIGERQGKLYTVFIELKETLKRGPRIDDQRGQNQLRWTLPLLNYLLFVFNIDNCSSHKIEDVRIRYFQFGKRFHENFDKAGTRDDDENLFITEIHRGIEIKNSRSPVYSLNLLLDI